MQRLAEPSSGQAAIAAAWSPAVAIGSYALLVGLAHFTAHPSLDAAAVFVLLTFVLRPSVRHPRASRWWPWLAGAAALAALAASGRGRLALDLVPMLVNAALCLFFARTLRAGSEPLIARVIRAIEGAGRLASRGVAPYARRLTRVWAGVLGVQALVLAAVIIGRVPNGLLATYGWTPPLPLAGPAWPWYLHFGSYLVVVALLLGEYVFRRRHLGHLPHPPLRVFLVQLVRHWPALLRELVATGASKRTR